MVAKRFTAEGKKMFNILVQRLGKKKARKVFYSLERKHPDWVANWRGENNVE